MVQKIIQMQEQMAKVKEREANLEADHELRLKADAVKRENLNMGYDKKRRDIDGVHRQWEREDNPEPPSPSQQKTDNTPRWEKDAARHKQERARLNDWRDNREQEIKGDNALDEKGSVWHWQSSRQSTRCTSKTWSVGNVKNGMQSLLGDGSESSL